VENFGCSSISSSFWQWLGRSFVSCLKSITEILSTMMIVFSFSLLPLELMPYSCFYLCSWPGHSVVAAAKYFHKLQQLCIDHNTSQLKYTIKTTTNFPRRLSLCHKWCDSCQLPLLWRQHAYRLFSRYADKICSSSTLLWYCIKMTLSLHWNWADTFESPRTWRNFYIYQEH